MQIFAWNWRLVNSTGWISSSKLTSFRSLLNLCWSFEKACENERNLLNLCRTPTRLEKMKLWKKMKGWISCFVLVFVFEVEDGLLLYSWVPNSGIIISNRTFCIFLYFLMKQVDSFIALNSIVCFFQLFPIFFPFCCRIPSYFDALNASRISSFLWAFNYL